MCFKIILKKGNKYFLIAFSLVLSACARIDYSPSIFESLETQVLSKENIIRSGYIRIRRGDSLYRISRNYGIPIRDLIETNKLSPPYKIYPGKQLKIPKQRYHVARNGETAYGISKIHNVDMGVLIRINKIAPPYHVKPGQKLRLPELSQKFVIQKNNTYRKFRKSRPRVTLNRRLSSKSVGYGVVKQKKLNKKFTPLNAPPKRSGKKFLWPVRGKVILGFGPRKGGYHNDGINISARAGTPVMAAENGVVAYVGNQLPGFGNLVLIKHSGGWMSAYAHGSIVVVRRGVYVKRGQVIAEVGNTGNVNRPQLHFELRKGDRAVDPRPYLIRFASFQRFVRFAYLNDQQDLE
tara:strand:+ start:6241 stop:7290 length:1050 start_codon:yes stop_codon:yes gene_type:complete